jgi:DNA-binding transcriptional ArsR family regulator
MNDPIDSVFRALADPTRRRILDLIEAQPSGNVSALADHFVVTRFAIMKHLRMLEAAGLLERRREGRSTCFTLKVGPLQVVHDRWMSRYVGR